MCLPVVWAVPYALQMPAVAQMTRPDWISSLAGAVPALRAAERTGQLDSRVRRLLSALAADLRRELAHEAPPQGLVAVEQRTTSTSRRFRDLVSSVEIAVPATSEEKDGLSYLEAQLHVASGVSSPDSPATLYRELREMLERIAAEAFGSTHVLPGHLTAGEIELAAVRTQDLIPETQAHLERCEVCRAALESYADARARTPFEQYPPDD